MNTVLTTEPQVAVPTILLADDDSAIVELVGAVLEAEGYRVLAARSAFEALHLAERPSARVDLLLTDLEMPAMDGTALWREVKRQHPQAKVVLMSGNAWLMAIPCVPLLHKPFTMSELVAKVKAVLYSEQCLSPGRTRYTSAMPRGEPALHPRGVGLGSAEARRRCPRAIRPSSRGTNDAA